MVGLCSRIVGDLNWSIAIVRKVRPEPGRSRLSLYDLIWSSMRSVRGAILLSESVCVSILNRRFNLRLVCCFLRFKKLKELSTAIFDSSINVSVVF